MSGKIVFSGIHISFIRFDTSLNENKKFPRFPQVYLDVDCKTYEQNGYRNKRDTSDADSIESTINDNLTVSNDVNTPNDSSTNQLNATQQGMNMMYL